MATTVTATLDAWTIAITKGTAQEIVNYIASTSAKRRAEPYSKDNLQFVILGMGFAPDGEAWVSVKYLTQTGI